MVNVKRKYSGISKSWMNLCLHLQGYNEDNNNNKTKKLYINIERKGKREEMKDNYVWKEMKD